MNVDRYQDRINRVAAVIAEALDEGRRPPIDELAAAAAFSPFHFQRIYRLLSGETVAETIRRLTLAGALERVGCGDTITEAAHAAGFSSSQNFAKAVRRQTGASASELRDSGQLESTTAQLRAGGNGGGTMALELVDTSPVRIACRLSVGPYDELNLAYRTLFEDYCRSADPGQITGVYGLPLDDPREVQAAEHRFLTALGVSDAVAGLGEGIDIRELGGGRHAMLRHVGPYSEVPAALDALYREMLDAGIEPGSSETFIHYVDQPGANDGPDVVHESHIYVPVSS